MNVTVRYFAGAKAAAGTGSEQLTGPTVRAVLDAAIAHRAHDADRSTAFSRAVGVSSYLLDGASVTDLDTPVRDGQTLDVLPPFAGG